MKAVYLGVVGDVGGTNARFALVDESGHIRQPMVYPAAAYPSLTDVLAAYLDKTVGRRRPPKAVIAVAGPVVDGAIEFTNLDWRISEGELLGAFDLESIKLINDFAAQAMAAPTLAGDNLKEIGPIQRGAEGAPLVVCGAGTGFGVGGLARSDWGDIALAAEGGHASFAPGNPAEVEVLGWLRERFGRVSIERVLSGQGLADLYRALADLAGREPLQGDEQSVMAAGQSGQDPLAVQTLDMFCGILGSVAGDLALTYGARGGVYLSGGIAPRMFDRLSAGSFRARFEDKGRLKEYMRDIPTWLIVHPFAALVGAARVMMQKDGPPL